MRTLRQAACALFLLCASVSAQSLGTINGRVTDQSGAALPGVTVVAINIATQVPRETITNAEGLFDLQALQPGTYDLRFELAGFSSGTRQVQVVTGTATTADVTLGVAALSEQVTVTGDAPLVETTRSGVTGNLRVSEVQNLPVLNRNFTGLVTLVPGARPAPITNQTKAQMGNGISVGGGRGVNVNVLVDGADNRDDITGGPLQNYTLEGVQEFTLMTHQFGAQYGRSSGAVLQIATKAGTNQLHGSGFFFGRNDAMTAVDYFTAQQGLPKNDYTREQFGGSLGGPILPNRWFIFGAVERSQQDFILTANPRAYQEIQYLTPFGAKPTQTVPMPLRDTMITLKSDLQLSREHALSVRWGGQRDRTDNDLYAFGSGGVTTRPDLSTPQYTDQHYWSLNAGHTWVVSNSTVNQLMVHRNDSIVAQALAGSTIENVKTGFPLVTRNVSFPSVQMGRPGGTDQFITQDKFQLKDDFSTQLGRHALKVGADFSAYPTISIITTIRGCGSVSFFDDPSVIANNTSGRYPQGFLTPGIVSNISQGTCSAGGAPGDSSLKDVKQIGAYVQDDWRLGSSVTLNLGVRYDADVNFFGENLLADSRVYKALRAIGGPFGALPKTDKNNVSPRIGIAWDMAGDGRSVLRGGYGLFFDPSLQGNVWDAVFLARDTIFVSNSAMNTAVGVGQLANYVFDVSPLPPGTGPRTTELPPGARTTGRWVSPDYRNPYDHQVHAGLTRQVGSNLALSVDATHVEGRGEFRAREINPLVNGVRRLAPAFQAALGDANTLGSIVMQTAENRSRYDEVIVAFERRGAKMTLQGNYTLAWARGYGGSIAAIGGGGAPTPQPVDQDNFFGPGEWGPASTDERHRIVLSGVFALPYGLQVSPVFQTASARPYNLTAGIDLNADGVNNDRYVDPATGRMVAVNAARGDASYNLDLRVTKFLPLGRDTRRLGVFAELFNVTNHANFGNQFVGNSRSPLFKTPSGYLTGLPTSRQLQLGARVTF